MSESIKIDIDINLSELREFRATVASLENVINNLQLTISTLQSSLQTLNGGLGASSSAFGVLESSIGLTLGALGLLALGADDLRNIPENINGLKNAFAGLGKKLGALTIGFKALPFVAVGVALVALINHFDETRGRIRDINSRLNESRVAFNEATGEIRRNEQANASLINRLRSLQSQENLTNAQRQEAIAITSALNSQFDGLNLAIDKNTGRIDENGAGILQMTERQNTLAASTSKLAEYQEQWFEAATGYAELEQEIDRITDAKERIQQAYEDGSMGVEEYSRRMSKLEAEYDTLRGAQAEFAVELEGLAEGMEYQSTRMTNAWKAMALNNELTLNNLSGEQRDVVDRMAGRWQEYADAGREMFDRFSETTEHSLYDLANNMEHNQKVTENWSSNLSELAKVHGEEFAEHMRDMGVDSAGLVAAMVEDMDGETARMAEAFNNSGTSASDNLYNGLDSGQRYIVDLVGQQVSEVNQTMSQAIDRADFPNLGEMVPAGLAEGARQGIPGAISVMGELAESLGTTVERLLQINSPSKVFMGYGENIIEGLCQGIEELTSQPKDALKDVASGLERAMKNLNRDFRSIGRNTMSGLNQGLLNGEQQVLNTARRIAREIERTMANALDINSPSRVMRNKVGGPIAQGVGVGIEANADEALKPANDLSKSLSTAFAIKPIVDFKPNRMQMANTPYVGHSNNGNVQNIEIHNHLHDVVIKEHADIERITRELHKQQEKRLRAQGQWNLA